MHYSHMHLNKDRTGTVHAQCVPYLFDSANGGMKKLPWAIEPSLMADPKFLITPVVYVAGAFFC